MPYTQEEYEEFLAHHGVKGMHWGVRKERTSEGQQLHDSRVKSAAIAGGFGAATFIATRNPVLSGLVATGSYFAARHAVYPTSSFSEAHKAAGKAFVEGKN
jgi:hypothetical protein